MTAEIKTRTASLRLVNIQLDNLSQVTSSLHVNDLHQIDNVSKRHVECD